MSALFFLTFFLMASPVAAADLPPAGGAVTTISTENSAAPPGEKDHIEEINELRKLRDPFKRPVLQEREERLKTELEKYPVTEFSMVGVITGPQHTRAILKAPNGKVYVVADGTRIGLQNGYIRKVLDDRVIVNEVVQDLLGEKEVVTQEIKLVAQKMLQSTSASRNVVANPPVATKTAESGANVSGESAETTDTEQQLKDLYGPTGAPPTQADLAGAQPTNEAQTTTVTPNEPMAPAPVTTNLPGGINYVPVMPAGGTK